MPEQQEISMVGFSCESQAKEELTVAVFPSATSDNDSMKIPKPKFRS